jgi:hypothetical protein
MDLALQVSCTETFNLTAADAVAEGVPCVTSSAIEWTPRHWHADVDSVEDIARIGLALLRDPHAPGEGRRALERHARDAVAEMARVPRRGSLSRRRA